MPPLQVLAHRIAWSFITLIFIVSATGGWGKVMAAVRNRKALFILCVTTLLISVNWLVFIYAVERDQVLQSSFGYFINPLVSVLLGFLFLGERLRRLQSLCLGCAIAGLLVLTFSLGGLPWISLVLAISFALYGLLRKIVESDPLTGLCVETMILFPPASAFLIILGVAGNGAFPSSSIADNLLLPISGVITAIPLLWFSAAARRLNLSTIGFMQYITPTIHFLLAVLAFGEPFTMPHLAGFACIWAGLVLFTYDAARSRPASVP